MSDREKVIKGLGIVSRMLNEMGRQNEMDIVDDALALLKEDCHNCKLECLLQKYDELKEKYDKLLKEQEAVEPYSMNAERTYGICPRCGKIIFRYGNVEENHYCGVCGEKVKWE